MRRPGAFALLAVGLAIGTVFGLGTASADQKHPSAQASAPQPIAEALKAGGGTVSGTVAAVGANWLAISDGATQADVRVRDFLPEGIREGDPITIVGRARHGGLTASEIILADGTSYGTTAKAAGNTRRADDKDDD